MRLSMSSWRTSRDTPPEVDVSPELAFNLIYSSGTTGIPKGIIQSRRYRAFESQSVNSRFGVDAQTRAIVATPLCSNTTLFFLTAVLAGPAAQPG